MRRLPSIHRGPVGPDDDGPPGRRRAPRWLAFLLFGGGILGPGPTAAIAQSTARWEAEASGSRIRYDSLSAINAPSISGLLEWRGPSVLARAVAGGTGFEGAGWTIQGGGDLSAWIPLAGRGGSVHLELGGGLAASRHSAGFDSRVLRAETRIHARARGMGTWIGAGWATARNALDSAWVPAAVPQLGVWGGFGALRASLAYQAPEVQDLRYHETSFTVGYADARLDVGAYTGVRFAPSDALVSREVWGGVSLDVWVRANVAIAFSAARYAPDLVQGLPGGDFVRVGVRVTTGRVRPVPEAAARAPMVFSGEEASRGQIGFTVQGAARVSVAGDWNDWVPEPLERDRSGRWLLPRGLAPGLYLFNLWVDEERWVVPEGVPVADDGFGGQVGILIIGGPSS